MIKSTYPASLASNAKDISSGQYTWSVASSEKVRIDADGLKFNGDTAAANALDDYEEGTWPISFSNGTFTYTVQSGFYTKIGDLVHVSGEIAWSSASGTGGLEISGLPFTSNSTAAYRSALALGYIDGVDNAGGNQLVAVISSSSTAVPIYYTQDNAASVQSDVANISASGVIQFSGSYKV